MLMNLVEIQVSAKKPRTVDENIWNGRQKNLEFINYLIFKYF
jgi:hypothetical protein